MNWSQVVRNIKELTGSTLRSISGNTDIALVEVTESSIKVSSSSGVKTRSMEELKRIVDRMELGVPIHVDSVLSGSGSSRNQPETILANLPDIEWLQLNGRKHIVWVGKKTHNMGTLRRMDEVEALQLKHEYRARGAVTGRPPVRFILRTADVKLATDLLSACLQSPIPKPAGAPGTYRLVESDLHIAISSDSKSSRTFEIIPVLYVPDPYEALVRLQQTEPTVTSEKLDLDGEYLIVSGAGISSFALAPAQQV